tara:strand:+ start:3924 stop:5360 length:1437 start_codon:yes stop_codon:yes gene_type:complete
MTKTIKLDYNPQPKQVLLHQCKAKQILFGGAAGGGKSHALRWDCIAFCLENPGLNAFIFRRSLPELDANHIQPLRKEMPPSLGEYNESRKRFTFHNGSTIQFQYLERDSDCDRIQGTEIHFAGIDEAGQMTAYQLGYIKSRMRLGGYEPKQIAFLPRLVMTANPGGQSHNYLKALYIDPAPSESYFYDHTMRDPDNPKDKGWVTMYIPSRMEDNKYIDPSYASSFSGLPEELARALRVGDWDLVVGSFFGDIWKRDLHVIQPFEIPEYWTKYRSFDWGSSAPFSVGWWAVAQGHDTIPDNALVRYREWYGAAGPNRGLRLSAEEVGAGIRSREQHERIDFSVGDPSIWKFDGGPSIGERLSKMGVMFRRADNSRIAGWDQLRQRLMGDDGKPMLYIFKNCTDTIRTLPVLVHDKHRIEDVCTDSEDHCADEIRYACMARPYTRKKPEIEEDIWRPPTIEEMMQGMDRTNSNKPQGWRL